MALKRIVAGILGAVVALGCAHAPKNKEGDGMADRQPVYVDDVKAPASVQAGKPVELTIEGNLPNPAWQIADVEIDKHDRHVTITVWARLMDKGPVIQMLEPFTHKVEVPDLAPGQWTLEVKGHGGTGEQVQVKVQ